MANAKVMQQSRTFPESPNNTINRNEFDLSFDYKTTFTMGKLVPVLVKNVHPNDFWKINGEFMFRFAPLYLPIMHRVNFSMDYFFIPYRILWITQQTLHEGAEFLDGWEYFIFNKWQGFAASAHPTTEIQPYNSITTTDPSYELADYMGFPTQLVAGVVATFDVNAFFFSAYYAIYDQYYRNDQIQPRTWSQLNAGDNAFIAADIPNYYYLSCKYRNWNRDNFTSATPTPQLGSDVQIPLVDADFTTVAGLEYDGPFTWKKQSDNLGVGLQNALKTAADSSTLAGVGSIPVYLDIMETAGTIAQLRYNLMMQEFAERSLRSGDRYSDEMRAFFNTNPFKGVIQEPEFLGTKKGRVVISEVMSTAETATLKVGNYAGQAMLIDSTSNTITLHALEHGVLMGILSVYPDSSYMQGIDKMWTRTLYTDYAWEQFALVGDEAILNKEVNADLRNAPTDADYNDSVFGYIPRYSDYRYSNDLYTGQMRSTYISFHLGRILSTTTPETTVLDDMFLQCRPDVTRVFQVAAGEDEIFAHIFHDLKVQRQLPKFGVPAI